MLNAKGSIQISHKPSRCLCCSSYSSFAHSLRRPTDNLRGDRSEKSREDSPRKPLSRVVPTLISDCSWVSCEARRYYPRTWIHALAYTSREGDSPDGSHRCPLCPPGTQAVVGNSIKGGWLFHLLAAASKVWCSALLKSRGEISRRHIKRDTVHQRGLGHQQLLPQTSDCARNPPWRHQAQPRTGQLDTVAPSSKDAREGISDAASTKNPRKAQKSSQVKSSVMAQNR